MAKVVEIEQDRKVVILSNEPLCYPNEASALLRLSYKQYERLNLRYGGFYGINWYFLGTDSIKYFDSNEDKWKIEKSPVTPYIQRN